MVKINQKLTVINEALETLKDSIELFHEYEGVMEKSPTSKDEQIFLAMRDSTIQRFEYCTDLFWKVLKVYLEEIEKVELPTYSPRGVIRSIVRVKTMSEGEGEACMEMIISRNKTSHIYHEEIAEDIAQKTSGFYKLMRTICDRVQSKIA